MKELLIIYLSFFKMSAVTFGGGYAMLPILQREVAEKRKWLSSDRIVDYYAMAQALPGIIAVNVSIFIGNERKKFPGGVAAALGVVSPCVIIIMIIAAFLTNFQNNVYVQHAFSGICVCVCALILSSVINLAKKSCKTVFGAAVAIAAFCITEFTAVSPVFVVIGAGILGVLWSFIRTGKAGKAE